MSTSDVSSNAQREASQVAALDKVGSHDKAYATMQHEIIAERRALASDPNQSADYAKFMAEYSKQLQAEGVLPDMALEFAEHSGTALQDGGGRITPTSVAQWESRVTDPLTGQSALDPLTKALADELQNQNLFQAASENTGGIYTGGFIVRAIGQHESYDKNAIDKYFQQNDIARSNRDTLAPLFEGHPPLFQVLDGFTSGGALDGSVAPSDLNGYVAAWQAQYGSGAEQPPSSPSAFSRQAYNFVKEMQASQIKYKDGNGNWQTLGYPFSTGGIASLCGFNDVPVDATNGKQEYTQLVQNFRTAHRADQVMVGTSGGYEPTPTLSTETGSSTGSDAKTRSTSTGGTVGDHPGPIGPAEVNAEAAADAVAKQKVLDELIQEGTVRQGEGAWSSAARLLGPGASGADIFALTEELGAVHQKEYGQAMDYTGDQFITSQDLNLILGSNPALEHRYRTLLDAAESKAIDSGS